MDYYKRHYHEKCVGTMLNIVGIENMVVYKHIMANGDWRKTLLYIYGQIMRTSRVSLFE